MFNSTHTLTGLVLARTGLDRWAPRATLTAVIAANLPDIDIVSGFPGSVAYIEHHRGITHSLIGIVVLSFVLAAALYVFTKSFWKTLLVALLAMLTHPALDYANTYGVQPFLPFSDRRYYGDTLYVIDPYLDAVLATGFAAGHLMKKRKALAWASVVVAILYIGVRVELRDSAREALTRYSANIPGVSRSAVSPEMVDPREFAGIVETDREYIKIRIHATDPHDQPAELTRMPKGDFTSPVVRRAEDTESGAVFRAFARFPAVRAEEIEEGYRVTFLDFRFYNERSRTAFGAEILLDGHLRPTGDSLSFRRSVP